MDRKLALTIQFAAMDRLSGALRGIVGLGDKGASALAKMKREARDLDRQLAGVRSELANASGNVTPLIARERELENAIAGVNRQMEKQKRFLAIDNRVAKVRAQAESYKSAGQQNMVAGGVIAAPLILAGREAMAFSSGMVDIQQKAELTNAETAKMASNILAAARAAHQMPEAMRGAVDVLAGFGMDPRQAAQLAKPIGRLGTAFKVELSDASAAAYANINNLKVPLAQVAQAFDIMAEGGKRGAFEIKDMARWFPSLTAQMQALGQKGTPAVADLTAALQVAMNTAGSADEAANNIANLLGKINSPTVINAFSKKFGVDLPAAMKKARAEGKTTMEAFAEIANKAVGGDLQKLGWVVEDRQAQMGLMALIQNMEQYRKIRGDIGKASGTVDKAFSQRELRDASVAWSSFKGELSGTAIVFGTTLLPTATRFLGLLNSMMSRVGAWAQANPRLASGLMTLVAGFAAARVGIGALQFAFGSVLGPMATAWGWWQKFRALGSVAAVFPRLAQGFGLVRTAALFMAKGVMRAGLMMLANPMVLAIVAIVAVLAGAGYLIWRHWDTIKAAFDAGLTWLGGAWNWIKAKFLAFPRLFGPIGVVGGYIAEHWGAIRDAFATGASWLGQTFDLVHDKVAMFSPLFLPIRLAAFVVRENWAAIRGAYETASAWLGPKLDWMRQKLAPFANVFMPLQMAGDVVRASWRAIRQAYDGASAWLDPAVAWARAKIAPIAAVFSPLQMGAHLVVASWELLRTAFTAGSAMLDQAWSAIKARFDAGVAFLRTLPGQMAVIGLAIVQGIARGILSAPGAVWNALKSVVMSGITNVKAFLGIKSPSRLFVGLGGFMTEGLAIGIERGGARPRLAAQQLAAGVAAAMTMTPVPAPVMGALAKPEPLRIVATIADPAAPRLPVPLPPRLPPPPVQRYRLTIAAPTAPGLPRLPFARIGSVIDTPIAPALPRLRRLRLPVDLDSIAAPRLPAAALSIKPLLEELLALKALRTPLRPTASPADVGGDRPEIMPRARLRPASAAQSAPGATGAPAITRGGDTYHIQIQQQPGEDGEALARRVMQLIEQKKRSARRGAYRDE